MAEQPETRYAKSDGLSIAYQVLGNGPIDLVYVPGWVSHLEHSWEDPVLARAYRRLASFCRLILFDKRGTGMSDSVPNAATLEERMDDVRAVLDAAGSERAAIFGHSEGGNLSVLFAATYPERTQALIIVNCFARRAWSPDYPWAPTPEERQKTLEAIETGWGGPVEIDSFAPSRMDDERFRNWFGAYLRRGASPGAALRLIKLNTEIDVIPVLPTIQAPTLVLHRVGDRNAKIEEARFMAGRIPQAKLVELDGADHLWWAGDTDAILAEIEEFLTGDRPAREPDRVLATVLFTDIVGSTAHAEKLGDRKMLELLEAHTGVVQAQVARFRGRLIKSTGDGFVGTFDGPSRGVHCALGLTEAVRTLGIEIRAGLHTGEIELLPSGDIGGVAVHIASRIMSQAGPGEVLASSTVKNLATGSGIGFEERGQFTLKGISEPWSLFLAR